MSGFTARPPAPAHVTAAGTQTACGALFQGLHGIRCERPSGHAGGHLSRSRNRYWQREEES